MKSLIFSLLALAILFSSCGSSVVKLGDLTTISTRNIDNSQKYLKLADCINCDMKTAKKNAVSSNLESAVDQALNYVPGGEYLMNVRVYAINGKYVVSGDVWGIKGAETRVITTKKGKVAYKDNLLEPKTKKEATEKPKEEEVTFRNGQLVMFKRDDKFLKGRIEAINPKTNVAIISQIRGLPSSTKYEVPLAELSK